MYVFVCCNFAVENENKHADTGMWSDFWFKLAIIVMIISQDQGRGQCYGRDMCESVPHHPLGVWGRHDGMQAVVETRERA